MLLKLQKQFKSISQFDDYKLPSFTVLTGKNGAGKSHLLQAIAQGHILTDIAGPTFEHHIRLLDFQQIAPAGDTNVYPVAHALNAREQKWRQIEDAKVKACATLHNTLLTNDRWRPLALAFTAAELQTKTSVEFAEELKRARPDVPSQISDKEGVEAQEYFKGRLHKFFSSNAPDVISDPLIKLRYPTSPIERLLMLSKEDFDSAYPVLHAPSDAFAHRFGETFAKYQALYLVNYFNRLKRQDGRVAPASLSEEQFVEKYGPKPWDLLNSLMEAAHLPFKAIAPSEDFSEHYQFQIVHTLHGVKINTQDLSSGERVLMSFALCLYHASGTNDLVSYPKVLLLDEIDATLHPSMVRTVLNAIVDVLVTKQKLHVILATHSPTTVALSPADAIHIMVPSGRTRIKATTKDDALALLCSDLPTLSVDYENRRQALTEGDHDARTYGRLFECLRPDLASPRSITFIAVDPHKNTAGGADRVKEMVKQLRAAGNKNVCGVLDWDNGRHGSLPGIFQMTGRYSIENWLLDPLLLVALLLREGIAGPSDLGLPKTTTYVTLANQPSAAYQTAVDSVSAKIGVGAGKGELQEYVGGFSLTLPTAFLTCQGHALEAQILAAIPELNGVTKGQGPLFPHLADRIARDHPRFLPLSIKQLFQTILA